MTSSVWSLRRRAVITATLAWACWGAVWLIWKALRWVAHLIGSVL